MTRALVLFVVGIFAAALAGCGSEPRTAEERESLHSDSRAALQGMEAKDADLRDFLNDAYGYAIFPSVGKGGLIVGGAFGRGEVYEGSRSTGYAELQQGTVGAQIGGQSYRELIVFRDRGAFDRFVDGKLEFAANASAVALKSGAAKAARYEDGVAIFTMPTGGLMAEASIGGQRFVYHPYEGMTETKTETRTETKTRNYD